MSNLELMKKRIEFNRKKQDEDYLKAIALRLAAKGKEPTKTAGSQR